MVAKYIDYRNSFWRWRSVGTPCSQLHFLDRGEPITGPGVRFLPLAWVSRGLLLMIVRVIFANKLESFREIQMVKTTDGELYPEAFITGKPDEKKNVKVYIDAKRLPYLLADGKKAIYREKA